MTPQPNPNRTCERCGRVPALGFAAIGDDWYCHGDQPGPTCYMLELWDWHELTSESWVRKRLPHYLRGLLEER